METTHICLLIAIGLPLLGSPLVALAGKRLGARVGWLALLFPVASTVSILALASQISLPARLVIEWAWIPSLGINLSFLIDGLSLFFGLIVSGMGCLVVFYAIHYLGHDFEHAGRFFSYLVLFMTAMLGTVFANNLMMMFVFWEMTGIASFLLIGFLHGEEGSRVGARQALLITATTGLAMLAGIIIIFNTTGTYDFSKLIATGLPSDPMITAAMILMIAGAFGKSAQFPFQFWLPNAMAAPTPVSAYLHSATMVKLGVFLCARIFPLFAGNEYWVPLVTIIPFTTMLVAAVLAFLSHDLKAILAYSTVCQLGFLIGYYGLGPVAGVEYDYLHILNHVLYKGSLFMIVGVVAHATGIRDIRQLGGLRKRLPLMAVATLAAAGAMAGIPGTTGFLSKEMMLKEIFDAMGRHSYVGLFATVAMLLASVIKVAFSLRLFAGIYLGREPEEVREHYHAPSLAMQLPPALLAATAVFFGLFPALLDAPLQWLAVTGLNRPAPLHLWHGFTKELVISGVMVATGVGLFWISQAAKWRWHRIPAPLQFDSFFERFLEAFGKFTKWITRTLRADQPVDYLPILAGATVLLAGGALFWHLRESGPITALFHGAHLTIDPLMSFIAFLIALSVVKVVLLKQWTTQLIAMSVAGFLICFYFVLYSAPDLALTQILIEVVTLFMILILLGRFPRSAQVGEQTFRAPPLRNALNVVISLCVGAMMTCFVLLMGNTPHPQKIGPFFLENTVPLADGSNAVNTILVDFRGFDTLGEIAVLFIAMLGCLGLLMRYKRTALEYRQGEMGLPGFGIDETGRERE
jgi:NADH:ubiquinone oxidoreductase subunit 5 (subunit L)/multisubunit Na+/H+ antiporter MnhA subunit